MGSFSFSGFETLTGGSLADTFRVSEGVAFAGSLEGGAGIDKLDYASYAAAVSVNLMTGLATGISGTVVGIENVTGGSGNDLIVGDAADNVLIGGSGSAASSVRPTRVTNAGQRC